MDIQWFPGHMTKTTRMMEDNIRVVDAVVYVLDARCPLACINQHFDKIIGDKYVVYALNKADLVPQLEANLWIDRLTGERSAAVALDSTRSGSAKAIVPKLKKLLEEKIERQRARGIAYTIKAMILGVPNSGKSTLINNLCNKARAQAGNRPGVTRGKQWLTVDKYLELLDTPGVLAPKLTDRQLAYHLAYCGSVKDDVLDIPELAASLISELLQIAPELFSERYGDAKTLADIARMRGYLVRGGDLDIERAASTVIDDFRKGRIGKIILESAR